jgi:hypothetical protein
MDEPGGERGPTKKPDAGPAFRHGSPGAYFFEQVGAADLRGAGFGACFFSHLTSTGLTAVWATGFWQEPVEGLGVTTVVVVVVVVVVPVEVPVVVPPPVTTAAERLKEAKARAEQASRVFIVHSP